MFLVQTISLLEKLLPNKSQFLHLSIFAKNSAFFHVHTFFSPLNYYCACLEELFAHISLAAGINNKKKNPRHFSRDLQFQNMLHHSSSSTRTHTHLHFSMKNAVTHFKLHVITYTKKKVLLFNVYQKSMCRNIYSMYEIISSIMA